MKTVFQQVNELMSMAVVSLGEIQWHMDNKPDSFSPVVKALIEQKIPKVQGLLDDLKQKASK